MFPGCEQLHPEHTRETARETLRARERESENLNHPHNPEYIRFVCVCVCAHVCVCVWARVRRYEIVLQVALWSFDMCKVESVGPHADLITDEAKTVHIALG